MVRSGKRPMIQIVKRIKEFQNCSENKETQVINDELQLSLRHHENIFLIGENTCTYKCCQLLSNTNERDEEGNLLILCRVYTRGVLIFMHL